MCDTTFKIVPDKIINYGSQGSLFLTIKNKKKYLTKNPVSKKEIDISKIMSNVIGPKIYDDYQCKTFKDTKNITIDEKQIKLKGRFLVMEKLKGLNLSDYINEDIFIEDDDILIKLLINKIKKMHSMGYYHGDLSSVNIFVVFNKLKKVKDIKIIDFEHTKKLTGNIDKKNDYNTLYNSIIDFSSQLDNIQPLLDAIENEIDIIKTKKSKK